MKKNAEQNVVLAAAWSFVVTGIVLISQQTAVADDDTPPEDSAARRQLRVEIRGSVPWLDKIPLVKTLAGVAIQPEKAEAKSTAQCPTCPATASNAAGPARMFAFFGHQEDKAAGETDCTHCPESAGCLRTRVAQVAGVPCVVREEIVVQQVAGQRATPCCATTPAQTACAGHHGCEQISDLKTEIASLHAELGACRQIMEERKVMFAELVAVISEKADLQAKLQAVSVEHQARERMLELMSENAKLKSMMELSIHRQSMQQESIDVAAENARLRTRVAELVEGRPATFRTTRSANKSEADEATHAK